MTRAMAMQVEQAIFTSARTRKGQGYQLVARSSGIDEPTARTLVQWGPSHAALASDKADTASLNFHSVDPSRVAISRTVYGGPEYSERGGLQLVTRFLCLRNEQLSGYDYNPLSLAREATALGLLKLDLDPPHELPPVDLPNESIAMSPSAKANGALPKLPVDPSRVLTSGGRLAVIGIEDPMAILNQLFRRIAKRQRLQVSFTTNLTPSLHRPFKLHFLSRADAALQRQLTSQGITVVSASK